MTCSRSGHGGLESLPTELLLHIVKDLKILSHASLSSIAVVSKHFYSIVVQELYRCLTINITWERPEDSRHLLSSLVNGSVSESTDSSTTHLRHYIREILVLSVDPDDRYANQIEPNDRTVDPSVMELLGQLILKLTRLDKLVWESFQPIGQSLLDSLNSHWPSAQLHVHNFADVRGLGNVGENPLLYSPCLYSLNSFIYHDGSQPGGHGASLMRTTHRILQTCPNLRHLNITERSGGFDPMAVRDVPSTSDNNEEVHYAPLESLTFNGYDMGDPYIVVWTSSRRDWSNLTSLSLTHTSGVPAYFWRITGNHLCRLISFIYYASHADSQNPDFIPALAGFLDALPQALEELSLTFQEDFPMESVMRHGSVLHNLELHHLESTRAQRAPLTSEALNLLRIRCPNLQRLRVDAPDRSHGWDPWEPFLMSLSQFPKLSQVQLSVDLGIATCQFIKPDIDELSMKHIFNLIAGPKIGVPLDCLKVEVGESDRLRGMGYPASWVLWEQNHRTISRADRGDNGVISAQIGLSLWMAVREKIRLRRSVSRLF